jgi:hypothetical protein
VLQKNIFSKKLQFTLLLLVLALPSQAALVQRDWLSTEDAVLTYDTDSGLEWLDVTVTAGMSYNEVALQLGAGGVYEGFTFASDQQVVDLFSAVDLQEIPNAPSSEGPKIQQLLSFWDVTWYLGTGERTEFLTSNTDGLNGGAHWSGRVFWLEGGDTGAAAQLYERSDDFKSFTVGSALVRTASPVPVPAAIWMFGAGLIGISGFIRRKKQ